MKSLIVGMIVGMMLMIGLFFCFSVAHASGIKSYSTEIKAEFVMAVSGGRCPVISIFPKQARQIYFARVFASEEYANEWANGLMERAPDFRKGSVSIVYLAYSLMENDPVIRISDNAEDGYITEIHKNGDVVCRLR